MGTVHALLSAAVPFSFFESESAVVMKNNGGKPVFSGGCCGWCLGRATGETMSLILDRTSLREQIQNGPFRHLKNRKEWTFILLVVCLFT